MLNSNQIPIYGITPKTAVGTLNAASAGALASTLNSSVVYTAPSSGAMVLTAIASSTDTSAVNIYLAINSGGVVRPVGQINIPANSGNIAGTLAVDCLNPSVCVGLDITNTGKRYILLGSGESLIISAVANMTSAKICTVTISAVELS